MATINDREYSLRFTGLTSTAVTAIIFLVVGFTLEETLKRLRRYSDEDKRRAAGEKVRDRGVEGWAMGYLFRARTFVAYKPTPDYGRWPLVWMWDAMRLRQKFFEESCGPDAAVYVRFLRGCFYWTLLLALTVFPVLLSINFVYSPADVERSSIDRASLSSLTKSESGKHLLWVHVICLWFITLTWFGTLAWIGYGAIRVRRNVLRALIRGDDEGQSQDDEEKVGEDARKETAGSGSSGIALVSGPDRGWRYRTVLVRNLPVALRSEAAIREYFEEHLRPIRTPDLDSSSSAPSTPIAPARSTKPFAVKAVEMTDREKSNVDDLPPLITTVVLVRKQAELNELFLKFRDVQHQLETAHCTLAQSVMTWVARKVAAETAPLSKSTRTTFFARFRKRPVELSSDEEREAREGDAELLTALRGFLPSGTPPLDSNNHPRSLWSVLHSRDPLLLDRFQPLHKLRHFHNQSVPSIDYHLAKLNLLSTLIEDKRADPEAFEVASSAFVTFNKSADARRARKELAKRPGSKVFTVECKVKGAPETRDLDWTKLVFVNLSSDITRGAILQTFIWAATLFWVIPISFLVGLLSLDSIAKYIPQLSAYLIKHPTVQSLISNLLPTAIVALLGMLVPTLINILTRNGQRFILVSALHAAIQARYWKWLLFNIVIVFCVGIAAFNAFLNAFRQPNSILPIIAEAFPKGATFFVSWTLLVVGIHHGIESSLLGIAWINHASIRKLKSPRKREEEALPRFFSYFYWVPNHLLVMAVTCIFAILNPLVITFNLAYFAFALVLFKNQFAHVYYRRWFENGGRLIYRRIFRYSLDTFVLAQVVAVALLQVLKMRVLGGACIPLIPITVFIKIIGTRWFDKLMDEIDEVEADLVCGDVDGAEDLSVPLNEKDEDLHRLRWTQAIGSLGTFATVTLPALTFRPHDRLPSIPSPSDVPGHSHTRAYSQIRHPPPGNHPRQGSRLNPSRSPTSLEASRPMLRSDSRESSVDSSHETDTTIATDGFVSPLHHHATFATASEHVETTPSSALITPHAPVVRDDRPVTHLRYDNPALVTPLERTLWLPRDPLLPLDLGDTVDYHGTALVSSEGGRGVIGSWDENLTEDEEAAEAEAELARQKLKEELSMPLRSMSSKSSQDGTSPRRLFGNERIRVASEVAARIEVEDSGETRAAERRSRSTSGSTPFPIMRRRGTGASSTNSNPVFVVSPEPSPALQLTQEPTTFHRHPLAPPRDSPPAIPSFDHQTDPSLGTLSSSPPSDTFPPSPSPRRQVSDSNSLQISTAGHHDLPVQRRPSTLSLGASPRSPNRRTRAGRSASHAQSMRMSIVEGNEEETISQATALRGELLEEERLEHEKRVERDTERKKKEQEDQRAGWIRRMVLRQAEEPEG